MKARASDHPELLLLSKKDKAAAERTPAPRVLLLIEKQGNREQVAKRLQRYSEVLIPRDDVLPELGFDLAIADGRGLIRWRRQLDLARQRELPSFLPIMLILSRSGLKLQRKEYKNIIDEFIIIPSEP